MIFSMEISGIFFLESDDSERCFFDLNAVCYDKISDVLTRTASLGTTKEAMLRKENLRKIFTPLFQVVAHM